MARTQNWARLFDALLDGRRIREDLGFRPEVSPPRRRDRRRFSSHYAVVPSQPLYCGYQQGV